ncbi:hypothetical protein COL516b_004865 [Colletotrichum fioriniae]|nr:uncharacterized protein COL516b_004865 [Colletotrichum fioriniae]KAJ0306406.1 hypothetical protein COL516b_004865 [Colletotrichum fioriniae]
MDEDQGPSQIVPGTAPKRTMGDRLRSTKNRFFTKDGLIGDYDYAFLFTPNLPFMRKSRKAAPFFGLNDRMPTLLALLLGFQHALAMLAGIITPPILLSGAAGANLTGEMQQYLVSTALIVSGLLSMIQITRFHILKTPYYIGTGLISVVGISFAIIPVAQGALSQMYANGFCPMDGEGNKLPCPDGYGVMLIGIHLIETGFQNWMGGSGPCANPTSDFFARCPNISAPHALPWGSAEYLGLGFSVFVTIILCERFGAPIMKSTSVVIGLLVGCIIAAATGYFDRSGIDSAPAASFIWVHTFKLTLYGPLILPLLAVYIICATEAIGDITATCDVSRLEVEGRLFESRIQGGVLADGINGVLAALMTITPMTTWISCFFLIIMGIFAKFAASLVAIPSSVLGGMTSFLFTAVAVSGMAIITKGVPFNRRNRFILTAGLTLGYGATLVPTYFDNVFTYAGDNRGLRGFLDAIVLIMETGFAITAFVCMFLNFVLDEEIEDTEGHDVIPTTGIVTPKDVNGGESARGADSEDIQPIGHNTTGKRDEKLS